MTEFPYRFGEIKSLYHRLLKNMDLFPESHVMELDIVSLSAEAKRRKIFEETQSEVLSRIRDGS